MILFEKLLANVAKKPKFVHFEDPEFEKYCIAKYDKDGDGKISIEEALSVTAITVDIFDVNTGNFSDLRYFENVKVIPRYENNSFRERVKRLDIPAGVTYLDRFTLGFKKPVIIVFHGKVPPKREWVFSATTWMYDWLTPNGSKIYVPDESLEEYKKSFTSGPPPLKNDSIIHPMSELNK